MEEILRIEHACLKEGLDDYCLSVCRNEIVYVQSFSSRDLHKLAEIIRGAVSLESGKIYLMNHLLENKANSKVRNNAVYMSDYGREFSDNFSVAENMNMNSRKMKWNDSYSAESTVERVDAFFKSENITLDAAMPMWSITDTDKRKLDVLRAGLFKADLTVMDLTDISIEGIELEEMIQLIQHMNRMGMTYLILSPVYSRIAEYATRIQYMYHGKDVLERNGLSDTLRSQLKGESYFFPNRKNINTDANRQNLIGFFDSEWDANENIWTYLNGVQKYNPGVFPQIIGCSFSLQEEGLKDGIAVIPENSQDLLIEALSVGDNLTMLIRDRIVSSKTGWIIRRLQKKAEEDFYRRMKLDEEVKDVRKLNCLHRKMLSVERCALAKPKAIILENPYNALEVKEIPVFRNYLQSLTDGGIIVIYFSHSEEQILKDCRIMIQTSECKCAKISTFSSKLSDSK